MTELTLVFSLISGSWLESMRSSCMFKLTQNKLLHLNFQVTIAKSLFSNFPMETPSHLPELEPSLGRCHYCKNEGTKQNVC